MSRKPKRGAPSKYDWRYDARLTEHMARGFSFESFGAEVGCHRDTLYEWVKRHPTFSDAKKLGEARREHFLIRMGHGIALGTHRYLVKETPVLAGGRPMLDEQGQPVLERHYASSRCNASAWIFLCKNMLGWRDRSDISVGGQPGGHPIEVARFDDAERTERLAELQRLQAARLQCGED